MLSRYKIYVENKPYTPYNPIHELVSDNYGVLLEAKVGERGWIAYRLEDDEYMPWHRLHISNVEEVKEVENGVEIVTENTIYKLVKVE